MKLILTVQNQTEAEKDGLEDQWAQIKSLGYVTIASREEPDLTWTTSITTVEAMIDDIRTLSQKQGDDSWTMLIRVRDNVNNKEKEVNASDYDIVNIIYP